MIGDSRLLVINFIIAPADHGTRRRRFRCHRPESHQKNAEAEARQRTIRFLPRVISGHYHVALIIRYFMPRRDVT